MFHILILIFCYTEINHIGLYAKSLDVAPHLENLPQAATDSHCHFNTKPNSIKQ